MNQDSQSLRRNTYDAMVIVDAYERARLAKAKNEEIDYEREAATLRVVARAIARNPQMLVIVPEHEETIERAYREAGFTLRSMNGNRGSELPRIINEEQDVLDIHSPKRVIFVGNDPLYGFLAKHAVHNNAEVAFWWPEALPAELNRPEYDFRRLEDVVPGSTVHVAVGVMYIDYENIHIGLERMGITPDPAAIVEAARNEAADMGKIVEMHAYADWEELRRGQKVDIQRELVKLGVKTYYQISKHGKNTADMDIVNDVRTRIDRPAGAPDAIDVVVLVTRDRDFATIVKHAQSQGKRVRILGLREGFSQDLAQIADDVRYLDSHFAMTPAKAAAAGGDRANDEQFMFIMRAAAYLQQKKYAWVYNNKLAAAVAPGMAEGMRQVRQALKDGLLQAGPDDKPNTVRLQTSHPDTYLAWWICNRLDLFLNKRHLPYVDTNFLKRGMEQDERLQAMGVGQSWPETKKLLERAAASGAIQKKVMAHPENPGRQIDTWRMTGGEAVSSATSGGEQEAAPGNEQEVAALHEGPTQPPPAGSSSAGGATQGQGGTATAQNASSAF